MIKEVLIALCGLVVGVFVGMVVAGFASNYELRRAWESGREMGLKESEQLLQHMQRRVAYLEASSRKIQLYAGQHGQN
jgi:uncharacterized membrane-anchored protein YhcB (DUF1043 family)